MEIIIGSARSNEYKTITGGKAGDQQQGAVPDFSGEVSLQGMYLHSKGWHILRAKNAFHALAIATNMFDACNNENIGYDQSDRYGVIRYGVRATKPVNCDCSSLVRECVREATGYDPGDFTTGNEAEVLLSTGLFELMGYREDMILYEGDILVTKTKGHTAAVTTGAERTIHGLDMKTIQIEAGHENPYTEPTQNLRYGAKGEGVKWIQYELTEAGYDLSGHGGIDGEFGSCTEGCVKAFQKTKNLTIDGIVGKYTRAALKTDKPNEAAQQATGSKMKFGIDAAKWQGVIDWKRVRASSHGDFAVLKVTNKQNLIEESFAQNYEGCRKNLIPIAVYRYVYAKSVATARQEAEKIVEVLSGRPIEGEVWLDMEDTSIRDIGKTALSTIIDAEAEILKDAGYRIGIYCNRDWYEKVLDSASLSKRYKFWIAKYGKNDGSWQGRSDNPEDIACAWQYTSKGRIDGISGYVDMNLIYPS